MEHIWDPYTEAERNFCVVVMYIDIIAWNGGEDHTHSERRGRSAGNKLVTVSWSV